MARLKPLVLRKYIKHNPKLHCLFVAVNLNNQSAISSFSDDSLITSLTDFKRLTIQPDRYPMLV
jgi:hypothetical protein